MRLLLLSAPCFLFFLLLEVGLALCGVRPVLYQEDPYVGFSSHIPLFVEKTEVNGHKAMVTAENKRTYFNPQQFEKDKPRGGFRIFCMGGSTTYGHPYDDKTSFCGWLRAMLPRCDPSRKWEVVNAGGVSYASYRVALLMEELARYQPDLFIIYTGHNEFLEQRTYAPVKETSGVLRELAVLACRTRTGTIMKRAVDAFVGEQPAPDRGKRKLLPAEVDTILEHSLGPSAYHRDDVLKQQIVEHFRFNLVRMIEIAQSAGAKVILVSPASNLRDCSPFKSEHRNDLSETALQKWEALFRRAEEAQTSGKSEDALAALDEAAAIDDRYAQLHYLRGQILYVLQRFEDAKAAFTRARDEDICPLRALSELSRIVCEVAAERSVPLVDFIAMVEGQSEQGIPSDATFLDHVHPTIAGYRQIALAILGAMRQQGMVHPIETWGDETIEAVRRDVESGIDREAHGVALRNVAMLFRWAGKTAEGDKIARRALELASNDAMPHVQLAKSAHEAGRGDEAFKEYRCAIKLEPDSVEAHFGLGDLLASQKMHAEAINEYRAVLRIDPSHSAAHCNLGISLAALGGPEEAIPEYEEAIRLEPDNPAAHYHLGNALRLQGKHTEAATHFREVLRSPEYAENPAVYLSLGRVLIQTDRFDEALKALREAARLAPNDPMAMDRLAYVLATHPDLKARDPKQAIALATQAARLTQFRVAQVLDTLALGYAADRRLDEARSAGEKALELAREAGDKDAMAVIEEHVRRFASPSAATFSPSVPAE